MGVGEASNGDEVGTCALRQVLEFNSDLTAAVGEVPSDLCPLCPGELLGDVTSEPAVAIGVAEGGREQSVSAKRGASSRQWRSAPASL